MDKPLLVYTTYPDEQLAAAAARRLVERRLAACVNIVPGMHSIYAWQGVIEEGREAIAIVKTRQGLADAVRDAIIDGHPYETPIVLFVPASGGAAQTLAWLMAETGAGGA